MSKTYMVAVDGSAAGWKALELAATVGKASGATIVALHVIPYRPVPPGLETWAEIEGLSTEEVAARVHTDRSIGDTITREAQTRARELGIDDLPTKVREGNVAEQIVEIAGDMDIDMIFLGSRGLSDVQGLLLGSVSHKVSHMAPCTCVLVR